MVSDIRRFYGGMIWTNHALDRLDRRQISQSDALATLKKPDKTFPGKKEESVKFIRLINQRQIHVVGKLNEDKQWVIMSVWVRGEEDRQWWLVRVFKTLGRIVKWVWKWSVGVLIGQK